MSSRRTGFLFWHKIVFLLAVSIIFLTFGIAFATWRSLNWARQVIEQDSKKILSEQIEIFLEKLVKERAAGLDVQLAQAQAAASYGGVFMGENLGQYESDNSLLDKFLSTLYTRTSHCTTTYFVSSTGTLRHYPGMDPENELFHGFDITREPFFPKPADFRNSTGEVIWSQVHVNPLVVNFDLVIDAVSPILVSGMVRGYIGVSVSLTRMIAQFNQYQPVRGSYSFLIDTDLQLVGAPPHARVELSSGVTYRSRGIIDLSKTGNPQLDLALQRMVLGESALREISFNKEPKYLAYHPLKNIQWRLGVVVSVQMATAASGQLIEVIETGIRQVLTGMLYWAGGFLILALFAGIMLARHLTSPIRQLSAVTENIARGNFEGRVDISSRDEMGILAVAFNTMADKIHAMITDLNCINQKLNLKNKELKTEITERKWAEEALRESEERFRNIYSQSPIGIELYNAEGYLIDANPACLEMFGIADLEAVRGFKLFEDPNLPEDAKRRLLVGKPVKYEFEFDFELVKEMALYETTKSGRCYLDCLITPWGPEADTQSGFLIHIRDITERKRMEEMMIQTEKMMSVGGLAAGMAHEINNPLSGILQSAQNIQRRTSPELQQNILTARECGTDLEMIRTYLEKRGIFQYIKVIREAGERAAHIIVNMLSFSRHSDSNKIPVNVSALIDRTVELASSDYDLKKQYDFRNIRIEREYDPGLPDVPCVETEISQVLLNLLRNAAQSMSGQKEPTITLRTCCEGGMARIEVEDNGPGMDETTRKRLFEPFFTTKEVGTGIGLGLSVSYFIITNNHQGTIRVESTEDKGTKFIIHLPFERRTS